MVPGESSYCYKRGRGLVPTTGFVVARTPALVFMTSLPGLVLMAFRAVVKMFKRCFSSRRAARR